MDTAQLHSFCEQAALVLFPHRRALRLLTVCSMLLLGLAGAVVLFTLSAPPPLPVLVLLGFLQLVVCWTLAPLMIIGMFHPSEGMRSRSLRSLPLPLRATLALAVEGLAFVLLATGLIALVAFVRAFAA